jgi:superfamily I DNA/RNA helicase
VVEEAQRVVPKIKYAPDASDGEVATLHPSVFDVTAVEPGNAVLCRNNAPLLQAALSCLQAGVGCVMLGRDVAKAITHQTDAAIKLSGSIRDTAMFSRLRAKYDAELADRPFALAQATEEVEMAATMFAYIQGREVPYTSEEELLSCIESICNRLLSDELRNDRIVFSTIHRSKGLEWPSVYLIQPEKIPAKAARKVGGWHLEQERNLAYVAITRAKERLVYVSASEDPLKWILELSAADHEDRQEED